MTRTARSWLKGCGIAAVIAISLVVLALVGSTQFLKRMVNDFESADAVLEEVTAEFGAIEDFRVEVPGSIDGQRVEAFLAARQGAAASRAEVEEALSALSNEDSAGRLRKARATFALPKRLAVHLQERNSALLETGLGLGEYYYLYSVVFYSWLGNSPADGPPFRMVGDNGFLFETIESVEESEVRRHRDEVTRRTLSDRLLPVLRRQLSDLDQQEGDPEADSYREALAAEIAAMEADPLRLPWEDGLPPVLESSLEPYRESLEASYSELCNPVDTAAARRT